MEDYSRSAPDAPLLLYEGLSLCACVATTTDEVNGYI